VRQCYGKIKIMLLNRSRLQSDLMSWDASACCRDLAGTLQHGSCTADAVSENYQLVAESAVQDVLRVLDSIDAPQLLRSHCRVSRPEGFSRVGRKDRK
jgi:hypothetical protein